VFQGKRILLIVSGGIAAYKCPELIRELTKAGFAVRCILTRAGQEFVTPMTLAALSGDKVYQDLFSLEDESAMGHIRLTREADLVVVAPATANLLAKMALGVADDLATTALLANDRPVMAVPAMNVAMWEDPATRANMAALEARGMAFAGPGEGDMACGEWGMGRMAEPPAIVEAVEAFFLRQGRLKGRRALVTSGPTVEAIDPVRFIANRSSGKQGHAIARALGRLGAETTLVSGPVNQPDPPGTTVVRVETAAQMLEACTLTLPVDVAVCAAAVADWRIAEPAPAKIKKKGPNQPPRLKLADNPDILATLGAAGKRRPALVVGFAAETGPVVENAAAKRISKGCDWILANDVSAGPGAFGGDDNTVHLISEEGIEHWPTMSKAEVGGRLAERIAQALEGAA